MWNQQKEKKNLSVLSTTVFVRISKDERRKADEFLLMQKLEKEKEKEERTTEKKCRFFIKTKLVKSKILHKEENEKILHICDYCQKQFSRSDNLKQHVKTHTGQKDYHCNLCDYSASQNERLQAHIRRHLKERPFKCQEKNCGAAFSSTGSLKSHQFAHNKNGFFCSACPFKTNRKDHLARHMKNVHSESMPFKCPHENCEYSAKLKQHLSRHLKIHSDEKNQVCPHPDCGFKTKWSSDYNHHIKIHSNEEKKYKCNFCDYSAHRHSDLVRHVRRHTGETPFGCQLCPYKSKDTSTLNRHRKTH